MKKIILIFLMTIIISPITYGQAPADTLFIISYSPSFHNPSQLTIYKDKDGSKGLFQTISIVDSKLKIDTAIATIPGKTYTAYSNFFSSYKFPDATKNALGLDGINISGIYYGDTKKTFQFWSPYRDKESMALFKMTLADLDRYFKTTSNKKYLRWLKKYSK